MPWRWSGSIGGRYARVERQGNADDRRGSWRRADEGAKAAALDVAPDNPKLIEALKRAMPFGRIGEPHEIAAAVAFLASEDAAFITGQTLSVSSGPTMV